MPTTKNRKIQKQQLWSGDFAGMVKSLFLGPSEKKHFSPVL